jgi:hypothetical protein
MGFRLQDIVEIKNGIKVAAALRAVLQPAKGQLEPVM